MSDAIWIRNIEEANRVERQSQKILAEITASVTRESELRREIAECRSRLPKLESSLADQEKATATMKRDRQRLLDALAKADALLYGAWGTAEERLRDE